MTDPQAANTSAAPKRQLTLFDSTCIIVGIIVGAGIYETAPQVAQGVPGFAQGAASGWWVMGLWLIGGFLSLCGAFAYAELATAYPREGGDYVYLTRAYGPWAGFLFGWIQLLVARPGDIAIMAFIFANYALTIFNPIDDPSGAIMPRVYGVTAVVLLTAVNIWGVKEGKWTQNVFTVIKVLGLMAIVVVALFSPQQHSTAPAATGLPPTVALILVLFTFGGWNEMAYVAAEAKNPRKNIVRALVLGTATVTVLYLLVNAAFLYTLGYSGLTNSQAVAADAIAAVFPVTGGRLISLLVCISALGAVNGLIFTGARISYAVGADHRAFHVLGRWNERLGTPARALLLQGALACTLILALGSFTDTIVYVAAPVYLFYLSTSVALGVLRWKEPEVERPYRATGYPVTTIIFCAVCGFLVYGAIDYKPLISGIALGIVLLGLPVYFLTGGRKPR